MATYTARIPTVEYGYIEVASEDFTEFVSAATYAVDSVETIFGKEAPKPAVTHDQAVQNLQDGGLVGNQAQAAPAAQQEQDRWGNPIIGTHPGLGVQIIYRANGKFGPCVQADKTYGSMPKNWNKDQVPNLDQAVAAINNRLEFERKKAAGEA